MSRSAQEGLTNPYVGGKLAVSDCSQVIDGVAVVVLCSEKFIVERGIKEMPVLKGYGHRVALMPFNKKMTDNKGQTVYYHGHDRR